MKRQRTTSSLQALTHRTLLTKAQRSLKRISQILRIATRVSTGDECSIIIEDGRSMDNEKEENTETKTWKAGAF